MLEQDYPQIYNIDENIKPEFPVCLFKPLSVKTVSDSNGSIQCDPSHLTE